MADNIFFFSGEEKFMLYQELKKWKRAFEGKYGRENIFDFQADNMEVSDIFNSIFGGGLFVSKKLIIIYGIPKDTMPENKVAESKYKELEDKLIDNVDKISPDTILALVSFKPDKRTKGFKFFSTRANHKQFPKLKTKEISGYVQTKLGSQIKDSDYLVQKVGDDMFAVHNEIQKLKAYTLKTGAIIDKKMIDEVVYDQFKINSFDILDQMYSNKQKTVAMIESAQKQGQDEFQFMGMLYWGFKNVIQMIDFYKSGVTSSKVIASKMKLHPFVAAKNMKVIDKLVSKEADIRNMFKKLIDLDFSIKTGKVPGELFWLEVKLLLR